MFWNSEQDILYLCRKQVEQLCEELDSVAVIREVFALHGSGQTILPDEAYLGWVNEAHEQVRNLNMPAYIGGSFQMAGTKIINGNPGNPRRGYDRASGLTLLYDPLTTRVLCLMESAYISSLRTASVTALSVELLQGKAIECVAVIGAGILAQAHISLLAKRLPALRQVWLFDTERARAEALQQRLAPMLQERAVTFQLAASAEEAIRRAQLVIPVTTVTQGYIPFTWLQPGTIIVNISLDDVLPDVVLQADKVIVDDWHLVQSDSRRLLGRMYRDGQVVGPDDLPQEGRGDSRRINAQLGDLVLGRRSGREHEDEIILVNPFGLAIEDMACATRVYQKALEREVGTWLPR